jgi:ubiquitin-conjugating enzyme E2 variant
MTSKPVAIADATHVLLASAFGGRFVVRIIASAAGARLIPLGLGVPAGFFAADVLSGLVHWFCDTCLSPETPLIGPMLIAPFREHHLDPAAIGQHGALERNGNNCLAALPLLAFGAFGSWDLERPAQAFGIGFLAAVALTLCLTNQIHAWAHSSSTPRVVRWCQQRGILLAPERHARHHDGSHTRAYAVVSGWSNCGLDWVLARGEAMLSRRDRPREQGANS